MYIYVFLYLYVPDEGSLLPKYRDCTTSNDFELCIYIYRLTSLPRIALLILLRPMFLPFLEGWKFLCHLYVPDDGSMLPKYRECTTSNVFELYVYIYIYIYIV